MPINTTYAGYDAAMKKIARVRDFAEGSDAVKDKVRANWKKWGLPELDEPDRNPTWKYFQSTGKGETGRRG